MTRISDDGQVGQRLNDRNSREIEKVARMRIEATHATLGQNDVLVSFGEDVFGR